MADAVYIKKSETLEQLNVAKEEFDDLLVSLESIDSIDWSNYTDITDDSYYYDAIEEVEYHHETCPEDVYIADRQLSQLVAQHVVQCMPLTITKLAVDNTPRYTSLYYFFLQLAGCRIISEIALKEYLLKRFNKLKKKIRSLTKHLSYLSKNFKRIYIRNIIRKHLKNLNYRSGDEDVLNNFINNIKFLVTQNLTRNENTRNRIFS